MIMMMMMMRLIIGTIIFDIGRFSCVTHELDYRLHHASYGLDDGDDGVKETYDYDDVNVSDDNASFPRKESTLPY